MGAWTSFSTRSAVASTVAALVAQVFGQQARSVASGTQTTESAVKCSVETYFLALSLLLVPVIGFAGETPDHSPAFTAVPELTAGFDLLYGAEVR